MYICRIFYEECKYFFDIYHFIEVYLPNRLKRGGYLNINQLGDFLILDMIMIYRNSAFSIIRLINFLMSKNAKPLPFDYGNALLKHPALVQCRDKLVILNCT